MSLQFTDVVTLPFETIADCETKSVRYRIWLKRNKAKRRYGLSISSTGSRDHIPALWASYQRTADERVGDIVFYETREFAEEVANVIAIARNEDVLAEQRARFRNF